MIPINEAQIKLISGQPNSKSNLGKDNPTLYLYHAASLTNMTDLLRNFSEYEMAHFINNNERWLKNRGENKSTNYQRGDILMIDLGAHNFRNEPSFPHPCVVAKATRFTLLVVPCSSKKYGKGYSEIIDATPADGFVENTGIQTTSYRWIHKNRVLSKMGRTNSTVLSAIDSNMLSHIPTYRLQINILNQELAERDKEIEQLNELSLAETALTTE